MKSLLAVFFALVVSFSLGVADVEAAKRLGGGKSVGMQREGVKPASPPTAGAAAPAASSAAAAAPAAAAAAAPKRNWMGPLAGLAAGIGLAALASHFGFGEGLANFMMIALLVVAAVVVFKLVFRRKSGAAAPAMQYAGAGAAGGASMPPAMPADLSGSGGSSPMPTAGRIPAGFDVEGFSRQAKLNFIRLQAANDAGNFADIREFVSPELFAEFKMSIDERGGAAQHTDVTTLNAEVIEVVEEPGRYLVSVHFHGLLREDAQAAAAPFDEIWHLSKPTDGSRGWQVAGIQQTQ